LMVQAGRARLHESPAGEEAQAEPRYQDQGDFYDVGTEEE
jgi:hypothetical protein